MRLTSHCRCQPCQLNAKTSAALLWQLYNLPVTAVHTANYLGKLKLSQTWGRRYKEPNYKKAYVYLADESGTQRPRYSRIEEQLTPEAIEAWPAKPSRVLPQLRKSDHPVGAKPAGPLDGSQ